LASASIPDLNISIAGEHKNMTGLEILAAVSAGAGMLGSVVQAQGTLAAGKAAQQSANYEAAQLEIKAKEEQAASQRDAEEHGREKDLALSRLQTNAAASGFSATDPTALAVADEIARYGTYKEQMTMYGGESRRTGIDAQAVGRRMEGRAAMAGAKSSAVGTILGGISSMAGKYASPYGKTGSTGGGGYYG
jgi:hypothetical protein